MKTFEELLEELKQANNEHIEACAELKKSRDEGLDNGQIRALAHVCRQKFLKRALAEIDLFEHPEMKFETPTRPPV
jgi:RNA polymerase-interacting CarD/CdnL/TRCF family regulator